MYPLCFDSISATHLCQRRNTNVYGHGYRMQFMRRVELSRGEWHHHLYAKSERVTPEQEGAQIIVLMVRKKICLRHLSYG